MDKNDLIKRNNINILGEGEQIIIFIHGYGCDQNMWRFVHPHFKTNYKIVLLDLVGSGKSDLSFYDFDKYENLQGYALDLVEIIEAFDFKNIILVGHSVSAIISGIASTIIPDKINKLIMVCPSPKYIDDYNYIGGFSQDDIDSLIETLNANYLGWSSSITQVIMNNPDKPELAQELSESFCRNDPKISKHFAKVTFSGDYRSILPKISIPTLILQCNSDLIAPKEVGEYMNNEIKDSKLVLMDAVGHCPHISHPQETVQKLENYLK
ncbi:MAG: alpha/beta hydrolase [Leptospira sp.]|nr:alpha/beta hydrolase [Leptospira sp.]NCS93209.1 alpha/beta hydrolase [Leptospira sp.]